MDKLVVTFGEIMGRMSPVGWRRLRQAMPGQLEVSFSGAEANVAVSVACLGGKSRFVTALPDNPLAEACLSSLKALDVDVTSVVRSKSGRLGLYFVETGANQRPSSVVYDRDGSAIAQAKPEAYDWKRTLNGAGWFHTTGITPSLSKEAADSALAAVKTAKAAGVPVSIDLNFRKKLWRWRQGATAKDLAREIMSGILPYVDLVIANEEDADDVLGIKAEGADVSKGRLDAKRYVDVAKEIRRRFPNVGMVAITLRESVSASHNNWGAMLYHGASDKAYFAPLRGDQYEPYQITDIVDRVGAGDSFGAALIFALNTPELSEPSKAVAFAVASSCLCHSVMGDFNLVTRAEVEALVKGGGSGRIAR